MSVAFSGGLVAVLGELKSEPSFGRMERWLGRGPGELAAGCVRRRRLGRLDDERDEGEPGARSFARDLPAALSREDESARLKV
jgi:hypothetical protein